MNLQEIRYFAALAEHRHFGRAAHACHVSQPTLSGQIRKLEQDLGVTLFERSNKRVALTPVGENALRHAKDALDAVELMQGVAETSRDQLAGSLKLGVIPTIAPYLIPSVLRELRRVCPSMRIDLWEDQTNNLLGLLSDRQLDAALVATELTEGQFTSLALFTEPFLAAVPRSHPLAKKRKVDEKELARDVLVLSEGHCLADQTLFACGRHGRPRQSLQAASLNTLLQLVAEEYGTTFVPKLAVGKLPSSNIVLRPLTGGSSRTIRLVSRPTFTRPRALKLLEKVVRQCAKSGLAEPRARKEQISSVAL